MISKEEYEVLVEISTTGAPDRYIEDDKIILELYNSKLIELVPLKSNPSFYCGYRITPLGKRAMEEYEAHMARNEREIKTIEIANEANAISRRANKISGLSLIVSIASGLIALASLFVAIFT